MADLVVPDVAHLTTSVEGGRLRGRRGNATACMDADVVVVGAGLAGLVATCELADAGRSVVLLDQEVEVTLGRQAWAALPGLFLVDSPEQRRMGISDSLDLAWQDWQGTAGWDRLVADPTAPRGPTTGADSGAAPTSSGPPARSGRGCASSGISFFPVVGWAERGDGTSGGHGNSVPRFHIPWGTGTGVVAPFVERSCSSTSRPAGCSTRRGTGSTSW